MIQARVLCMSQPLSFLSFFPSFIPTDRQQRRVRFMINKDGMQSQSSPSLPARTNKQQMKHTREGKEKGFPDSSSRRSVGKVGKVSRVSRVRISNLDAAT